MEVKGYREALEVLRETFPGQVAISTREAARALGVEYKTVFGMIHRDRNPLPTISSGGRKIVIPIPAFAKWLAGAERKL